MLKPVSKATTFTPERAPALAAFLARVWEARSVSIHSTRLLSGGAVQENWCLDLEVAGGPRAGTFQVVLRTDAASRISLSLGRRAEFEVLAAAHRSGVRVAEPLADCDDATLIGQPFSIQAFIGGSADARSLVRRGDLATVGPDIARELGRQLALIHAMGPSKPGLDALSHASILGAPPDAGTAPARREVERLRRLMDGAGEPRPALEYILCWLDARAPVSREVTLVHGDFRTGNYLVEGSSVTAVLDWEFAHWGDPVEDIGWFCARSWRFGNDDLEAGGIATRAPFRAGYETVRPLPDDDAAVDYWEIMAAAKWAAVAVAQGDRYRKGGEESLELALTGLMAPQMELDALLAIERFGRGDRL